MLIWMIERLDSLQSWGKVGEHSSCSTLDYILHGALIGINEEASKVKTHSQNLHAERH